MSIVLNEFLLTRARRRRARTGRGGFRLEALPIILDVFLDFSMTPARVEIVVLHLLISRIVIPAIVVESVHRSHESGPMTSARAMDIERPVRFLFGYVQEL